MTQTGVSICRECGETDVRRLNNGARGLCARCYHKTRVKPCDAEGCDLAAVGRYCSGHQRKLRLYGFLEPIKFAPIRYCEIEGCYNINEARGLCRRHADTKRRTGSATYQRPASMSCEICGDVVPVEDVGPVPTLCYRCYRRTYHVAKTYKLSALDYITLIEEQDSRCAICDNPLAFHGSTNTRPVVDHCHKGGHIRGILCGRCNSGLGMFQDQPQFLLNAARYLEHRTSPNTDLEAAQ